MLVLFKVSLAKPQGVHEAVGVTKIGIKSQGRITKT